MHTNGSKDEENTNQILMDDKDATRFDDANQSQWQLQILTMTHDNLWRKFARLIIIFCRASNPFVDVTPAKASKTVFGSFSPVIDRCLQTETFQLGGNHMSVLGPWVSRVAGPGTKDDTGLGHWSGVSLKGPDRKKCRSLPPTECALDLRKHLQ
jgi:hypothetical protein